MCMVIYQHSTTGEKPINSFTRFHTGNKDLKEYLISLPKINRRKVTWNIHLILGFTITVADFRAFDTKHKEEIGLSNEWKTKQAGFCAVNLKITCKT